MMQLERVVRSWTASGRPVLVDVRVGGKPGAREAGTVGGSVGLLAVLGGRGGGYGRDGLQLAEGGKCVEVDRRWRGGRQ